MLLNNHVLLQNISILAKRAGIEIMKIFNSNIKVNLSYKNDLSPVTNADILSHEILVNGLKSITPFFPILSEENLSAWTKRKFCNKYWLIDPLDGTKEFIKKNKEFTVNIALIENKIPVIGVIYVPAKDVLYSATSKIAWKETNKEKIVITVKKRNPPKILISRSNRKKSNDFLLKKYLNNIGKYQIFKVGSSLKFCLIAEGKAQFYPRFESINIWDMGAGQIIVTGAGGFINDWKGKKIDYSPKESFLNPGFHVYI